jgi:hypothetical protein
MKIAVDTASDMEKETDMDMVRVMDVDMNIRVLPTTNFQS